MLCLLTQVDIFFHSIYHINMKKFKMPIIAIVMFALFLATDLILKAIFDFKNITLIKGVFSISYAHNTGAGFSILSNQTVFLICITLIFMVLFTVFNVVDKDKKTVWWWLSNSLIYAGAIGNLIDRIIYGYVRDFLYFELINFPVFNFADMCLTIGVVLYCINFLFVAPKLKNKGAQNGK